MEMDIRKFKLIGKGYQGAVVTAIEPVRVGRAILLDEVTRIRHFVIDQKILDQIQDMKYFFLSLTYHWIAPFNKYFDLNKYTPLLVDPNVEMREGQSLMFDILNRTEITGMGVTNDNNFFITGTIEIVSGKKIGIATPKISEEDDFSFYEECTRRISDILMNLADHVSNVTLDAAKNVKALEAVNPKLDASDLTSDAVVNALLEKFEERGLITLMPSVDYDQRGDEDTIKKGGSIDSHKFPVTEEVKETKEVEETEEVKEKRPKEKKVKGKKVKSGDVEPKGEYAEVIDSDVQDDFVDDYSDAMEEGPVRSAVPPIKPKGSTLASEKDFPDLEKVGPGISEEIPADVYPSDDAYPDEVINEIDYESGEEKRW